jgi:prephenate dehydratase
MKRVSQKIAFQGAAGAFSDLACRHVYPGRETLPCASFEETFQAVRDRRADLAMIPVDNSLAGRVADVHHLLPHGGLYIIGEHFEPIRMALLGVPGAKINDLKYVHSHVHAIPQCRKIIRQLKLKASAQGDTAGAARDVASRGDKAYAAIASSLAADIYSLKILRDNIQDADHNTTRFLILSREKKLPPANSRQPVLTSLLFRTRNIPAALYKALGGFATNGVSIAKLESYVDPTFQAAQFYCEAEAHPASAAFKGALEELSFFADHVNVLGAYPVHPFRLKKKSSAASAKPKRRR